ncbi:hypothetical protein MKX03_033586, partial [Papaver bracteatum]
METGEGMSIGVGTLSPNIKNEFFAVVETGEGMSIGDGHYHSLDVTSHGDVWSWGRNKEFHLSRAPFAVP